MEITTDTEQTSMAESVLKFIIKRRAEVQYEATQATAQIESVIL